MKALNDRVICKLANMPEKTKGGILLPDQAFKDGEAKINIGLVVSAGEGVTLHNGEKISVGVKKGDVIAWEQFGALRMEILGPKMVCVRSEDIGGQLEEGEYDMGWFEDFEGGQHSLVDKIVKDEQTKIITSQTGEVVKDCECETQCQECGLKDSIKLKVLDATIGKVDDSNLPDCRSCGKPSLKVTKKKIQFATKERLITV
jgi:chaperonin GroES